MNIHEIIKSQKNELESRLQEKYIKREVSDSLFQSKLIKVIIGPRRAGKSFFAVHHLKKNKDSFGYMNFDDERLADISDISAELERERERLYNNAESRVRVGRGVTAAKGKSWAGGPTGLTGSLSRKC